MSVGNKIREIRISKGMTLEGFGLLFTPNASKSNVSKWEHDIVLPNQTRLRRIAEIGNTTVDSLLNNDTITISIEEYEALKQFKWMYEELKKVE